MIESGSSLTLLLESPMLSFEQVIGKARVPIIKFIEKQSGISFDIRYNVNFLNYYRNLQICLKKKSDLAAQ